MGYKVALATLVAFVAACRPPNGPSVHLPNTYEAPVFFAPDGERVLARDASTEQVYLFDLRERTARWRVPGNMRFGASFSPGGALFVLVTQRPLDPAAEMSLRRTSDGATVAGFARRLPPVQAASPEHYTDVTETCAAVTDDGRALISALPIGVIEAYAPPALEPAQRITRRGYCKRLALDPGAPVDRPRFVVEWRELERSTVLVFARADDGSWREEVSLPDASRPAWVPGGILALAASSNVVVGWDGRETRRLATLPPRSYGTTNALGPAVFFSPDGAYVATSGKDRLDVHDLRTGRGRVASVAREAIGAVLTSEVEWAPGHLRAFLGTGDFVDVDLASGKIAREVSFGSTGSYTRNLFSDGSSWDSRYVPHLGPGGRWLDQLEGLAGHRFVALP